MEMSGEYRIPAPRETVWEALNDPEILKASIPGCEELTADGDNGFSAKVRAKVGPVSARFSGKVQLRDLDPPNGYRIEGEGTGGAAGFAKGGATVKLTEDGSDTLLNYEANASVGGKLAQIGSRLIDGTAKKMADDFFAKFSEIVAEKAGRSPPAAAAAPEERLAEGTPAGETPAEEAPAAPEPPHVDAPAAEAVAAAARETGTPPQPADVSEPAKGGIPQWAWIGGAAVVVVVLIYLLT